MASDRDIADKILTHQLHLARLEAGDRKRVLALIRKMQSELNVKLNSNTLTELGKADVNRLLKQANETIEGYYQQAAQVVDMPELAINTAKATSQAIEAGILTAVSMPTDKYLLSLAGNVMIEGAPSAAWWAKQSQDMQFKFAGAVRQGLIAAETNAQIVRRVTDAIAVSRRNAAALVQTSVAAVASDARMAVYKDNADLITALTWLSVMDSHSCKSCFPKDGLQWDMDYKPTGPIPHNIAFQIPPQHFSCRCQLVPRTKMFDELGLSGARATAGGPFVGSFDDFLNKKGPEFQDKMFGPGRAKLWRDGKITRANLLDNRGNELTLKELNRLYGASTNAGIKLGTIEVIGDYSNIKNMPASIDGVSIIAKNYSGRRILAYGGSNGIAVNTSRKVSWAWGDMAAYQAKAYESGFQSSPNPNHVILHELAHVKVKTGSDSYLDSKLSNLAKTDRFKEIAGKVSKYATTNGHEFVAEVYAAVRGGVTLPDEVLEFYKFIGGPEF
jgi:SPP1 gp7 family putative phage head morphogenesis protein